MISVFYIEREGVITQVLEGENTYKIVSVMPNRHPQKIETEYEYNRLIKKGTLWSINLGIQHGMLEALGYINAIESEGE